MTSLLGRRGDPQPVTCCVCGRFAHGLGVSPQFGKPIAWLCLDPTCIELGQRIYVMQAKELGRIEGLAIGRAGQAQSGDILECVLGALWDAGIRNLEQADAAAVNAVREKMQASPEFTRALEGVLKGYGAEVKRLIDANEAPF